MWSIGWGLVFQKVRNFYHFKFSLRERPFYDFKSATEPSTFTASRIPKISLRSASVPRRARRAGRAQAISQ